MSELIQLDNIGTILSNIGNKIIQNQNILKCLKYTTSDCLTKPNIGIQDIKNICGKGMNPVEEQRLYKTPFNNKILDKVVTELRFFIPKISPENIYLSELMITFQIIVHNTIWDLDNNQIRPIVLIQEILQELNGCDIESIGELQLVSPINIINWNDNHAGYQLTLKTRTN